jgi:hypothetical protein
MRRIKREVVINVKSLHVKYPLFLSDFDETWILSTDFRKEFQIKRFIKIHPVGTKLFHADSPTDGEKDRQTDRQRHDEANSRFSQFFERTYKLPSLIFPNLEILKKKKETFLIIINCFSSIQYYCIHSGTSVTWNFMLNFCMWCESTFASFCVFVA